MSEDKDILNLETVNIAPLDNQEEKKYSSSIIVISANKTERCILSKIVLDDKSVSESDQVKSEEDKSIVVEKYQEEINKSKGKQHKKIKSDNYLGKRVECGLFQSSTGATINADLNGAIGILRKADVISNTQLISMRNRGDLVSPVVSNCLPYKKTKFSKNPNGLAYKARFGK